MDTAVAIVDAYLHLNGYVSLPEQPILIGHGRPWRYHTRTDVDILALRFPNAAVTIPRGEGVGEDVTAADQVLTFAADPRLQLRAHAVDVMIAEVKEGRPRLNEALRDPNVLFAVLKRLDAEFDEPIENSIRRLIKSGEAECNAGGRLWRFRLVAFGEGTPIREGGPYTTIPLRHAASYVMRTLAGHRQVWRDAQFSHPVLDLLHLFDKLGLLKFGGETNVEQPQEETSTVDVEDRNPNAKPGARPAGGGKRAEDPQETRRKNGRKRAKKGDRPRDRHGKGGGGLDTGGRELDPASLDNSAEPG